MKKRATITTPHQLQWALHRQVPPKVTRRADLSCPIEIPPSDAAVDGDERASKLGIVGNAGGVPTKQHLAASNSGGHKVVLVRAHSGEGSW